MKVTEKDLIVGVEYFLDTTKTDRGILVEAQKGYVLFRPTAGHDYAVNEEGLIRFNTEGYTYETV